jgi:hypothetical protein
LGAASSIKIPLATENMNNVLYVCHHHEHNQGLGIEGYSFKVQGVFGLSILV